ncbi:Gfo/Idh/MocA family protein [Dyadobacter sp. 32]|uniref:Gfo/Idh/MocA family protein n=1 Tax=Dyadobacter sp. 32 TaxID=538966 RepID=UPI0011ED4F0E
MDRRDFIQKAALTGSVTSILPNFLSQKNQPGAKVRLGFVGVGSRGGALASIAAGDPDVEINAICDISQRSVDKTLAMLKKLGRKAPSVYSKGEEDFRNMVKRDDLDAVIVATPWQWHVPAAVAAMNAGKYAGVEVPAALTIDECWELVNTHEKTGSHCMILENVCYRRDVMAILNMIRKGMFGELTYAHCGYQHDLREVLFNDGKTDRSVGPEFGAKAALGEGQWRTQHYIDRNGDLYPTHGLGPVAHWLDINRGNRFTYLTSTATKSRSLHNYMVDKGGISHPNTKVKFSTGDVVTTVVQCHNGENVVIMHDTSSPRPYSLGFRAQGTEGIWMEDGATIFLEDVSPKPHTWEPAQPYLQKYDHGVWKKFENEAKNAGHGGIDFFVIRSFIETVKRKKAPLIDVYDAATWSAISPLSETSVARGSSPVEIPDFTRGKWRTNPRIFGLTDEY